MSIQRKLRGLTKYRVPIVLGLVLVLGGVFIIKFMPQASVVVFSDNSIAIVRIISPDVNEEVGSYTIALSISFSGGNEDIEIPSFTAIIVGADGWTSTTMASSVGSYATGYLNQEVSLPQKDQSYTINMAFTSRDIVSNVENSGTATSTFSVVKIFTTPTGSLSLGEYPEDLTIGESGAVSIMWSASDSDGDLNLVVLELWDTGNSKKLYSVIVYTGAETLSESGSKSVIITNDYNPAGSISYSFFLSLTDASGLQTVVEKSFLIDWVSTILETTAPEIAETETTTYDPYYDTTTTTHEILTDPSMPVATDKDTSGFELLAVVLVIPILHKIKQRKNKRDEQK